MKSIFLALPFFLIFSSNTNNNPILSTCNEFYLNENIKKNSFEGKIISKKEFENRFVIKIEQNGGDIFNLNLYPNKIGKEIYEIVELSEVIKKNKNEHGFILISRTKNNDKKPKVIVFNKLCSED